MYDSKSEAREFLGDDVAEATAKAISYLGLDASALVIRPVADASGLAGRALVVGQPIEARQQSRERGPREPREREDGKTDAYVEMTMTSPMCPAGPQLIADCKRYLSNLEEVESVEVKIVMDPPWTPDRMTEDARDQLGIF